MRYIISGVAVATALAVAVPADAQSPFSIEVSGYGAVPAGKLGGAKLETGFGFGGSVAYRFMPQLGAYAGWDWNHFRSDELIAGQTIDVEDTGYTFGIRYEQRLGERMAGWLRGGGLYKHIELENADGNTISDSGHGFGWEAGAGLAIPLGERLRLTPGAHYRTLTRDLQVGAATSSRTLSYFSFGAGVSVVF